jgi:hypothetical protein
MNSPGIFYGGTWQQLSQSQKEYRLVFKVAPPASLKYLLEKTRRFAYLCTVSRGGCSEARIEQSEWHDTL